jgi:two-component system, chemotaxis family, chemotaxis protein CheV
MTLDRLEIGGNAFEIIEFWLEGTDPSGKKIKAKYGVNVAKVREVIRIPQITPLSSEIKAIAGLFELRGVPIPAIKLSEFIGNKHDRIDESMQIIITEFSGKRAGFIVDGTSKIRRINWEDVKPVNTDNSAYLNGMTLTEDKSFLFIVDLERIVASIESEVNGQGPEASYEDLLFSKRDILPPQPQKKIASNVSSQQEKSFQKNQNTNPTPSTGIKLLVVDDSKFILDGIAGVLRKIGYEVYTAGDGQEAVDFLEEYLNGRSENAVDLVVSDVEMPRMNGLALTKWIKDHPAFERLPVIFHSSLSGRASIEAGLSIGAQGYVVKNDIKQLERLIKEILGSDYLPGSLLDNAS